MEKEKVDYGNWVSNYVLQLLVIVTLGAVVVLAAVEWAFHQPVVTGLAALLVVLMLAMLVYMWLCRRAFAFDGGGLMGMFHAHLVEHLDWDGRGTLLDVGCGSGALSIRCAKQFPEAEVVGIDYWGKMWNYGKAQCERNAAAESVVNRIQFERGDAARLAFADDAFDAVVSNFVFHEVKTQPDKQQLVLEALRVLKPGGSFAFQDLFDSKMVYGDIRRLFDRLRADGYTDLHYIGQVERQGFVPRFLRAPWMICHIGLIYGRKPGGQA